MRYAILHSINTFFMYNYIKKTYFLPALVLLATTVAGQSNITQWGGTITTNAKLNAGEVEDFINGSYNDFDYWGTTVGLQVEFHALKPVLLTSYGLSAGSLYFYGPSAWTLSGSNDGTVWVVMDSQSEQELPENAPGIYPLDTNTVSYSYYQLAFTAWPSAFLPAFSEWELFSFDPPPAPPAPVLGGSTISGTEASLSWSHSKALTDTLFLERSADGSIFKLAATPLDGKATSYLDQTLSPSSSFYYRLRAKNVTGSNYSNIITLTTSNQSGQSTSITYDGGTLSVSADNRDGATSNEGSASFIDHNFYSKWLVFEDEAPEDLSAVYKPTGSYIVNSYALVTANDAEGRDPRDWIFSGSDDSTDWVTLDARTNQLGGNAARNVGFTFPIANPGSKAYKYYRILFTANNNANDGVRFQISEWEMFGVNASSPAIPINLSVTATTVNSASLSWLQPGTNPVTGFILQRSYNGLNFATIDTLAANASTYTDNNLYDSTAYYYHLQALGNSATAKSGWSGIASGTTAFTAGKPLTPTTLQIASFNESSVRLQWVDRSYNETGFRVERSSDGIIFTTIETLPANTTSHKDSTVWPATTYYYRIVGFNEQAVSGYSNTAIATTTGANTPPQLTQPFIYPKICSNAAEYTFTIAHLVPGTGNEVTQQLGVTGIGADSANATFFSNLSFVPTVTNGVATFTIKGSGKAAYGDTATIVLTVKDNGGTSFFGTDSLLIPFRLVYAPLTASISADIDIAKVPRYVNVHLTASTNYASTTSNYNWDEAAGIEGSRKNIMLTVEPTMPTTYTVHATSISGCTATAQITVTPTDEKLTSNILTPNGDGKNDRWIIWGIQNMPNNVVKVFDRGGRMVFYKQNYTNDWDGTSKGSPLPQGAYYYVLEAGDGSKPQTGMLTIVRDER